VTRAGERGSEDLSRRLRQLPAVDRIAQTLDPDAAEVTRVSVARRAIDEARDRIRAGAEGSFEEVAARAQELIQESERSLLQPVINATGVLIHTNLGRVPLGQQQLEAVTRVAGTYSNLEYDLNVGHRGSRYVHTTSLIRSLTGAESALVVNNNAAAVLIALAALCQGREVLVSRGELIEIGGEFRVPDIMTASGAVLAEVGTTNRTRLEDYERAITSDTAAILKVHPSNYRLIGFTASVAAPDLARLARGRGVAFLHDIGSGLVEPPIEAGWLRGEPTVRAGVSDADIVTFSGDKLLGGPQAGVLAGRKKLIEKISKHPLMRAVRVDKMTLAALEKTLMMYLQGHRDRLPLWEMASAPVEELEARARGLITRLATTQASRVKAVTCRSVMGGGSLPGAEIDSWGVTLTHPSRSAAEIERNLRHGAPPIIARIEDDNVVLDLRTVSPQEDEEILQRLEKVLA
jgi:L-seryl-tRNA(Ser) seleniumtransferase